MLLSNWGDLRQCLVRSEVAAEDEKITLHLSEILIYSTSIDFQECSRGTDLTVQLIHRPVCFDSRRLFSNPLARVEACLSLVPSSSVQSYLAKLLFGSL